ncbi:MAG: hypothetical protein AAF483_00060 [Planctomycetota bacterium]
MTLLGKVFTALIFLLSVVFFLLGVAVNSTHISQKLEAEKWRAEAQKANEELTQSQEQTERYRTDLAIERAARRATLAAMQEQLTTATNDKERASRAETGLQASFTAATETNNATATELKARTEENTVLRDKLKVAREDRDQLFGRLVKATDDLSRLQGTYASLVIREKETADSLTKTVHLLSSLGINPDTELNAPATNGEIVGIDGTLVEVNLGRDDGLRTGHTLEVHRNGQYLGRLSVKTVRDGAATARILEDFQRGYIRVGDTVDTQLEISITRKK